MAAPGNRTMSLVGLVALTGLVACGGTSGSSEEELCLTTGEAIQGPYTVGYVDEEGSPPEHRLSHEEHHFLSWIDPESQVMLRMRPGEDANGWGSTVYLSPFLAGAAPGGVTSQCVRVVAEGVELHAKGKVPAPGGESAGTFDLSLRVSYDPLTRRVSSTEGRYDIDLDAPFGVDLSLLRVASNRLVCVPLQGGGCGSTGDMERVAIMRGAGSPEIWVPETLPSHHAEEEAQQVGIEVTGTTNQVLDCEAGAPVCGTSSASACEALASGTCTEGRVAAACKPTVTVDLQLEGEGDPAMRVAAELDVTRATDPRADNVAVTPLLLVGGPAQKVSLRLGLSSTTPCE